MEYNMNNINTRAIVLAAGKAKRFKTKKTKLLFNLCGRTMILYSLKILEELNLPITTVLGYQADQVQHEINQANIKNISSVVQIEQRGTGDAVLCSKKTWDHDNILVMNGDCPLITKEIIEQLLTSHQESGAAISLCTTHVIDPSGYGRIVTNNNTFTIVEDKDCTPEQKNITKINAGIYCIKRKFLEDNIEKIEKSSTTGEWYFTDIVTLANNQGQSVNTVDVPYDNVRGVNTLQDLWSVEQIKRSEFIKYWMSEGVRFELAQSIHIDINVKIGAGSFIGTGVHLLGNTIIGEESFVGAFSIVENTRVGHASNIHSHSVIQDSIVGDNVHVGPFARLRNNTTLGDNVTVGNFVEIKESTLGSNSKAKHQSYLGNATIGESVNIGAGTIVCNYDGFKKHKTVIEDNVFIGSNNTLIAPITIGKGAYTAGGSTINENVPADSLAIGRSKQSNKDNYAKQLRDKACDEDKNKKKGFNFRGAVKTSNSSQDLL